MGSGPRAAASPTPAGRRRPDAGGGRAGGGGGPLPSSVPGLCGDMVRVAAAVAGCSAPGSPPPGPSSFLFARVYAAIAPPCALGAERGTSAARGGPGGGSAGNPAARLRGPLLELRGSSTSSRQEPGKARLEIPKVRAARGTHV